MSLVEWQPRHPVLEQETLQGRMRRRGRLLGHQGAEGLFGGLPTLGGVGKVAVTTEGEEFHHACDTNSGNSFFRCVYKCSVFRVWLREEITSTAG